MIQSILQLVYIPSANERKNKTNKTHLIMIYMTPTCNLVDLYDFTLYVYINFVSVLLEMEIFLTCIFDISKFVLRL